MCIELLLLFKGEFKVIEMDFDCLYFILFLDEDGWFDWLIVVIVDSVLVELLFEDVVLENVIICNGLFFIIDVRFGEIYMVDDGNLLVSVCMFVGLFCVDGSFILNGDVYIVGFVIGCFRDGEGLWLKGDVILVNFLVNFGFDG